MTDIKKESLSALIDGEASEIEVHRLVREYRNDDSLIRSWALFQQVRTVVRRSEKGFLPLNSHLSLHERISAAVDEEETHDQAPVATSHRGVVAGSLALAASLVVAVFISVQEPADETPVALGNENVPVEVQTVADTFLDTPELTELDEEKQRILRAYLNQHERMVRMNPDAQLVNYKKNSGK